MQNFTLIPNPKAKFKKTLNQKVFHKKLPFCLFFQDKSLFAHFFSICSSEWNEN